MNDNDITDTAHEALTRRDTIKYGGAVVGGGLLAGCTDSSESDSTGDGGNNDGTTSGTVDETENSYEACIEPAGCLTLEEIPDTWLAYNGG